MNMQLAMYDTLEMAWNRLPDGKDRPAWLTSDPEDPASYAHLFSMVQRAALAEPRFSDAKTGRWLGYMQGVIVTRGYATLEEMKELNRRRADA